MYSLKFTSKLMLEEANLPMIQNDFRIPASYTYYDVPARIRVVDCLQMGSNASWNILYLILLEFLHYLYKNFNVFIIVSEVFNHCVAKFRRLPAHQGEKLQLGKTFPV